MARKALPTVSTSLVVENPPIQDDSIVPEGTASIQTPQDLAGYTKLISDGAWDYKPADKNLDKSARRADKAYAIRQARTIKVDAATLKMAPIGKTPSVLLQEYFGLSDQETMVLVAVLGHSKVQIAIDRTILARVRAKEYGDAVQALLNARGSQWECQGSAAKALESMLRRSSIAQVQASEYRNAMAGTIRKELKAHFTAKRAKDWQKASGKIIASLVGAPTDVLQEIIRNANLALATAS